jgi:hypothetical protein
MLTISFSLFDVVHIFFKLNKCLDICIYFRFYLENKIFTQMDYSYTRIKDRLFSDTIPVSDRDSNEGTTRQRRLTRPRVGINIIFIDDNPGERRTAVNGRDVTENTRKLEAVFRPGIFWIFSGGFQQLPVLSGGIRPEMIGTNPGNSRPEYCFHVPGISRVFLQEPVTFPHLSWKILRDPVAGTIDLGIDDATVEPFIFILNLTLMIDEHGDEGKSDGEGEDGGENTDEIEDLDEAESKGLNCRCAPHNGVTLVIEVDFQQKSIGRSARCSCYRGAHIQKFHCICFSSK